jgi:hypothetical protein
MEKVGKEEGGNEGRKISGWEGRAEGKWKEEVGRGAGRAGSLLPT